MAAAKDDKDDKAKTEKPAKDETVTRSELRDHEKKMKAWIRHEVELARHGLDAEERAERNP